jgi:hypothetical protein
MVGILEVCHRPYDQSLPVLCMDESDKQLGSNVIESLPSAPGKPLRIDDEYARREAAGIFMAVEPLAGWRRASVIKKVLDRDFPNAKRVVLVMENLYTHGIASLCQAFPPEDSLRLTFLEAGLQVGGPLNSETRKLA